MPRLFIFAIGGTGSRVLKSLTMLLAAGIKPMGQQYEIVPIIIDPHKSNADLSRAVRIMDNYQSITNQGGLDNGFFSTRITTLDQLVNSENVSNGNYTFDLQDVANKNFRSYINHAELNEPNQALTDILFSGQTVNKRNEKVNLLDVDMEIGFVGNPNIGSIVLNQFKDSEEYKIMASNFNADDRIFIISSIFGGTGAAGFPSVLKIIRNAINQSNIHSKGFLQNAKIGAITALPYFNIENTEKSPIQKSEFIAKSRAALYYYKDNITKNNSINALYYIADDYNGKPYKNDPGNDGQQNPAHFVELISALSVIDFIETPDSDLETINGKASRPIYKSFGMKDDLPENKFSNFEANTEGKISCALSQMVLFKQYINHRLKESVGKQAWSIDEPTIGNAFLNETFFRTHITEFMSFLGEWLKEMAENRRNLAPFNLKTNTIDTLLMDKDVESGWLLTKTDFSLYDDKLSKNCKGKSYNSPEQKFIKLFYDTTKEILTSKFGFKK